MADSVHQVSFALTGRGLEIKGAEKGLLRSSHSLSGIESQYVGMPGNKLVKCHARIEIQAKFAFRSRTMLAVHRCTVGECYLGNLRRTRMGLADDFPDRRMMGFPR